MIKTDKSTEICYQPQQETTKDIKIRHLVQ